MPRIAIHAHSSSILRLNPQAQYQNQRISEILFHSHSIVAGGLLLISYTTLFIPFTLLMISLEISARNVYGKCAQSAVIPSTDVTARNATVNSYVRSSPITPTLFTGNRIA